MKRVVGEAHDQALQLLSENRERLEALADALFRAETLEGPEAYAAAGVSASSDPVGGSDVAAAA
jgi:cell division protease FtsH